MRIIYESFAHVDVIYKKANIEDEKFAMEFFNQDAIRDNFSAITILIDSLFDGVGGPGGAVPNAIAARFPVIGQKMLKSGCKNYGKAQDMVTFSTQNASDEN